MDVLVRGLSLSRTVRLNGRSLIQTQELGRCDGLGRGSGEVHDLLSSLTSILKPYIHSLEVPVPSASVRSQDTVRFNVPTRIADPPALVSPSYLDECFVQKSTLAVRAAPRSCDDAYALVRAWLTGEEEH